MASNYVRVIFDRRKKAQQTGKGWLEACIYLKKRVRRYVKIIEATPEEWQMVAQTQFVQDTITKYERVRGAMEVFGEPLTLEVLNHHLGLRSKSKKAEEEKKDVNFLDFMAKTIEKEKITEGTRKHKHSTLLALKRYGRIKLMSDLTPANIREFDTWLRETGERSDTTVHGYHKHVRIYARLACQQGYIAQSPYEQVQFLAVRARSVNPSPRKN